MNRSRCTLVVGLGSHHGDDRAGWLVTDSLDRRCPNILVRRALIPLDLLDWLDGVDTLHVCDAYEATSEGESLLRLTWSRGRIAAADSPVTPLPAGGLRGGGTHDFGLTDVLQLAESAAGLPQHVTIWAVPGREFQPGSNPTPSTQAAVAVAVDAILAELSLRERSHA